MAQATEDPPTVVDPLVDKFALLASTLNDETIERGDEIHGLMVALASGSHMFMLGSPGIAKSYLLDRLLKYVTDVQTFKILVSPFTKPEEMFGPIDVAALKNSHYKTLTDGYLPGANVAFVDEIWKTSAAILNSLLGITNEREFRNDGVVTQVPLSTMLCASNELPQSEGLAAIADRIMLWYEVKPIADVANFVNMLQLSVPESPAPILTWDDVNAAKKAVADLPIQPKVYDTIAELRVKLKEKGIEPTDRRFMQLLKLLRAEAWLDGAEAVEVEHITIAAHALWQRPEQQADVAKLVLELANPLEKDIVALQNELSKIAKSIDTAVKDTGEKQERMADEIFKTISRAGKEYKALRAQVGTSRRQKQQVNDIRTRLRSLTARMVTEVFGLDPADMPIPDLP